MELDEMFTKYFKDVYRYILRMSGNEHIAEDITSETFFKAIKSIDTFRGDCDMRVWLCQIAKNSYYTYIKKTQNVTNIEGYELENIIDPSATVDENINREADLQRIKQILHSLPEPYREVFMWRVFAELSFKQIGELFSKSDNWACVTYHRARLMIKDKMED